MSVRFDIKGCIIYFLIFIACMVFASFYGGLLPYTLLFGVILLLPVSVIMTVLNYHFLSVYQELDGHRVGKGEQHKLVI